MHAISPIVLDNEPKSVDPNLLICLKINTVQARESILAFNQILWGKNNGYLQLREEVSDLGLEEESDVPMLHSMTMSQESKSRVVPTRKWTTGLTIFSV